MSRKKCLLYPKKIIIIYFLYHPMKNLNGSLSKLCIIEMNIPSFYAAAKSSSITKAADELMVTPPAITMQIKQLEKAMSIRFLVRDGNTIHLTKTGEAVFCLGFPQAP